MEGKAKVTAVLHNPDGIYENEFKFNYPDGTTPPREQIAATAYVQFQAAGMTRKIDELTYEIIPWHRVKQVDIVFNAIDTLGLAGASFTLPKDAKLR